MANRAKLFAYRAAVVVSFSIFLISCALWAVGHRHFLSASIPMLGADLRHDIHRDLYFSLEGEVATVQCHYTTRPIYEIDYELRLRDGVPVYDTFRIESGGYSRDPRWATPELEHYLWGFGYQLTRAGSGKDELLTEITPKIVPIRDLTIGCQVPLWFVVVTAALLPARWVHKHLKLARRRRRGACLCCGYDLRASSGKCPECGNIPEPKLSRRRLRVRELAVLLSGLTMVFAAGLAVVSHWREADFYPGIGWSSERFQTALTLSCRLRRDTVLVTFEKAHGPVSLPAEGAPSSGDVGGSWADMEFEWAKHSRFGTSQLPSKFRAGYEHRHYEEMRAPPKYLNGRRDTDFYHMHFPPWMLAVVAAVLPGAKLCQRLRSIRSRRK